MKVTSIGAGNLATSLCMALHKAGHRITQVYSRTQQSAQTLADMIGAEPITDISCVNLESDIYVLSLTDNILPDMAVTLVQHLEANKEGGAMPLILHTAGSIPMDVIPANRRGVLYPMQTFTKSRVLDFSHIPVFVEASNDEDARVLTGMSHTISDRVIQLSSAERRYLHLAAVFCSNFANHCYALADQILLSHDIPFSVMLPLIDEVAAKVHAMSPQESQTGPARRHDTNVMKAHMQMLESNPRMQQVYRIMSESIADD